MTLVEGNEVSGSFYLNDTDAIAASATAEEMASLLEATDLGDVSVSRYVWNLVHRHPKVYVRWKRLPGGDRPQTAHSYLT